MNFLFVDSDVNILDWYMELFEIMLPQVNFCMALDVKAALASCVTTHFSLIVTDSRMPGISGEDLVRHLRSSELKSRDAPVILVSGQDISSSSETKTFSNVYRIQKPVNGETLLKICCELANIPMTTAAGA